MLRLILFVSALAGVYSQVPIACDPLLRPEVINVTDFPALIFSPFFNYTHPENSSYGTNQLCLYEFIQEDTSKTWEVAFFNFSVEHCTDCSCDYFNVYDDRAMTMPLASLCNEATFRPTPPGDVVFTGTEGAVEFFGDDYDNTALPYSGYMARVGFAIENEDSIAACSGGVTLTAEGFLNTVNFPDNYAPNSNCIWDITAPVGQRVRIEFPQFATETTSCEYDYVTLYDALSFGAADMIGEWYGNQLVPGVTSSGNNMRVRFVSDITINAPGFVGTFTFV